MVLLRGARGSLEWKGKRLKCVANESARAWRAWRILREKNPRLRRTAQPAASLHPWPAQRLRGADRAQPVLTEPWAKPAGPLCPLLPTDPAQGGSLHPVYPKVAPWASLYSG